MKMQGICCKICTKSIYGISMMVNSNSVTRQKNQNPLYFDIFFLFVNGHLCSELLSWCNRYARSSMFIAIWSHCDILVFGFDNKIEDSFMHCVMYITFICRQRKTIKVMKKTQDTYPPTITIKIYGDKITNANHCASTCI